MADPATREALARLAESRQRMARWVDARARGRERAGGPGYHPRSATMQALLFHGARRLPWLRWAFSAFMLWRSLRRR